MIKTQRLHLREYKTDDIELVHELAQDPDIYRYQIWGPNSLEDTTTFINACIAHQTETPRKSFELCMTDIKTNEVIGSIGIRIQDTTAKKADLGYWIRKERWGKGLATEASLALIDFGFKQLEMNKIWAMANPKNPASLRVLKKIGMNREGNFKSNLFLRGEYHDSIYMAVLKEEYLSKNNSENA